MKSTLEQAIRKARARRVFAAMLDSIGYGFALSAAAAIGLLAVTRLAGFDLPVLVYPAVVLAGVIAAAMRVAAHLPASFDVALYLDRTLRLRDRLATAYVLSANGKLNSAATAVHREGAARTGPGFDDEFAAMVREDGERLAEKIDVRSLAPVRIGGAWGVGAALSALLFLGVLYMPVMARGGETPSLDPAALAEKEQAEEERDRLRDEVDRIMADIREDEDLAQLPGAQEELKALERLAEQLAQGVANPDEVRRAREETAARLNELADQLQEQAQRDSEAAQRLTERFAGLESPERPMSAQEFDDALRRGEFGAAAESLQDQLERAAEMDEAERRELAEHLRRTAEATEQIAEEEDRDLAERLAQLEQLMREFGLDEDLLRDAVEGDEEAMRDAMQQLNEMLADEEQADRLKRELDRMRGEQDVQEQLKRDLEQMQEAMREAADELDPEGRTDPDQPDPRTREQGDPDREQPTEPQPGAEPDDPDEPRDPDQPQAQEDPPSDRPDPDAPQEPQQQEQQQEQQQQAQERPDGETGRETMEEGAEQDGAQQEGASPEEGAEPEEGESSAAEQRRTPSEKMREVEERHRAAERRQQAAERARQRARELADSPDRDFQRELERQLARDPSGASEAGDETAPHARRDAERQRELGTEDVDARIDDDDPGRVVAEWFDDEELAADPEVRRAQVEQRMREAQRVAERAVEEAAVPARYHEYIRRLFGRFDEQE